MGSYTVVDRRRVTPTGTIPRPHLTTRPRVDHKPLKAMVEGTWRHVSTHLERGVRDGDLRPETLWTHIWGLAISTQQTHDGVILLIADRNKPKTLPLQGAILVRSMLEVLGNVMALTATSASIKWFLADGYRRKFEEIQVQKQIFGARKEWKTWFEQMDTVLDTQAHWAGLGASRRRNPSRNIPDWPSPYWLTRPRRIKGRKRPLPVLIRGNRAKLFEEGYRFWYSQLSAYAHQRSAAAHMAIFASNPDAHWEPGALESIVASEALLFFAATMSELETAASMPPSRDLRVLWSSLWDLDEEAKRFVRIRYRRLLALGALKLS